MSHSAIISAASDFMRRKSRITSASLAAANTSRDAVSISVGEMRLRIAVEQADQARGVGADQVEQIGRELGDAEQDVPREGMMQQRVESRPTCAGSSSASQLSKPVRPVGRGRCGRPQTARPMRELSCASRLSKTSVQVVRVARRGSAHATFCGTSGVGAASLSLAPRAPAAPAWRSGPDGRRPA